MRLRDGANLAVTANPTARIPVGAGRRGGAATDER